MSATFTIDTPTLTACLAAVDTRADAARGSIAGLHVALDNDKATLTATDGHRLHQVNVRVTGAGAGAVVVDASAVERLTKALRAFKRRKGQNDPIARVTFDGSAASVEISSPDGSSASVASRGDWKATDYPDFAAVIPAETNEQTTEPVIFAPQYLADAYVAAASVGAESACLRFGSDALSAATVRARGTDADFLAVVMPRRH